MHKHAQASAHKWWNGGARTQWHGRFCSARAAGISEGCFGRASARFAHLCHAAGLRCSQCSSRAAQRVHRRDYHLAYLRAAWVMGRWSEARVLPCAEREARAHALASHRPTWLPTRSLLTPPLRVSAVLGAPWWAHADVPDAGPAGEMVAQQRISKCLIGKYVRYGRWGPLNTLA